MSGAGTACVEVEDQWWLLVSGSHLTVVKRADVYAGFTGIRVAAKVCSERSVSSTLL
jgi:hypothetical protein